MFEFYHVYKGEYNTDTDAALSKENIEKLRDLMQNIKTDNLNDASLIVEIEQACEDALTEIFDEE
ncbi:hypothetical protein F4Z99_04110 [Candidatus Poribacteria bacterium]|nr:hypothetical protein [Candidatus Poribacteria bacterium]